MTTLPNPFSNSGASSPPDEAAVPFHPQVPEGAAADLSETPAGGAERGVRLPETEGGRSIRLGSIDCIGEIFVGAAKLEPPEIWFENSAYPREDELLFEVLEAMDAMADPRVPGLAEMPYGMEWALDAAPLFLQNAEAAA